MSIQTDLPVNANKALWEKGDFTRIAESMRDADRAADLPEQCRA